MQCCLVNYYILCSKWVSVLDTERDLVDNRMNKSQQSAAVVMKANWILGCIHRGITSRDRDIITLLYSALVKPHMSYSVHLWSAQFRKDVTDWRAPEGGS